MFVYNLLLPAGQADIAWEPSLPVQYLTVTLNTFIHLLLPIFYSCLFSSCFGLQWAEIPVAILGQCPNDIGTHDMCSSVLKHNEYCKLYF
jgi:hypothetical protein